MRLVWMPSAALIAKMHTVWNVTTMNVRKVFTFVRYVTFLFGAAAGAGILPDSTSRLLRLFSCFGEVAGGGAEATGAPESTTTLTSSFSSLGRNQDAMVGQNKQPKPSKPNNTKFTPLKMAVARSGVLVPSMANLHAASAKKRSEIARASHMVGAAASVFLCRPLCRRRAPKT